MLQIKPLVPDLKLPSKAHAGDAGWDVYSRERVRLLPGEMYRFKLGFAIIGKPGKVYIVEGKSGMAESGIDTMGNVIDNQYRGEVSALLINHSQNEAHFTEGMKIAQILVQDVEDDNNLFIDNRPIEETDRGDKAYGSSGQT